jgi:ligand-binding SRPBCC domain-containing protein
MGDEVTWEARHFGVRQRLTVRVTAFDRPNHFRDIMTSGAFKKMVHDHEFAEHPTGTLMRDCFDFESPMGILGKIADWLFLTSYMRRFLVRRNEVLKRLAESAGGNRYLEHPDKAAHHGSTPGPSGFHGFVGSNYRHRESYN